MVSNETNNEKIKSELTPVVGEQKKVKNKTKKEFFEELLELQKQKQEKIKSNKPT